MYPRNAASPEPIAIGPVVQISDGAVQTAGVTVRIKPVGVAEADGGGTTAYSTDGVILYTPTQAETNYTSFVLIAKKTGCIPASVTVVTTASATAGYAGLDWGKVTSATSTVNLSGTTMGSVTGAVGSVTARVTANTDQWGGVAVTGMPLPTASYTAPDNATIGTISTNLGTVNTNVLSRLASSSYVPPLSGPETAAAVWNAALATYTTAGSFGARVVRTDSASAGNGLKVTGAGHGAADIHEIQDGVITAADFAADWLTAAGLASDAVTKIQNGLATAANLLICNDRVAYALTALVGACSDAQTAAETYTLSINGSTFTVDYSGLDASGNRGTTTLTKV